MNFLFVDQLLSCELAKRATGIKHVTARDTYLFEAPNGKPALISCIVGEALGQLCSWAVIKTTNGKYRSVAGIVSAANLYDIAYVGDVIELYIDIDYLDEQAVNWHGEAQVRGKKIFEVESAVGPCLPMEQFNHPEEVMFQLAMIDRPEAMPALPESTAIFPSTIRYYPELTSYDNILSWEKGKEAIAQKRVSVIEPYFVDHFPRKPVLPITILLESNLQLAQQFLKDMLGEKSFKDFIPVSVRKIKMKDFVQPGSIITTKLTIKSQSDNEIILSYRSEMHDKVICVSEAVFNKR